MWWSDVGVTRGVTLWDEHPIVVVAQRRVDWKLVAGQLNTVSGTNSMEFITHPKCVSLIKAI